MRKTLFLTLLLLAVVVAAWDATAAVKRVFPRVTTTTSQTFTYYTADGNVADVTLTADVATPNGTFTIYSRQREGYARTLLYTAANPTTGTVTYSGPCQGVLEVQFTSLSTGTVGLEVLTR